MKKLKLYYVLGDKYDSAGPIVLAYNKRQACSLYYRELGMEGDFEDFSAILMEPNEEGLYEIYEDEGSGVERFRTIKEVEYEIKRIGEPCFGMF